jgi:hypothetical protein
VAAEVVQQPARLLGIAELAPAAGKLGPPALEPRLEAEHATDRILVEQPQQRQEIAVPAPILLPDLLCGSEQLGAWVLSARTRPALLVAREDRSELEPIDRSE